MAASWRASPTTPDSDFLAHTGSPSLSDWPPRLLVFVRSFPSRLLKSRVPHFLRAPTFKGACPGPCVRASKKAAFFTVLPQAWLRTWSWCQIPLFVAGRSSILVNGGGDQAPVACRPATGVAGYSMALLRPRPDEHGGACSAAVRKVLRRCADG
jgi:hypothetical protein